MAWTISPDWNNPHVKPIANYVGTPIVLLVIPAVSFVIDIVSQTRRSRATRTLVELFVGVPAWFFCWIVIEFTVLGWVWI
jgi:hypothetical protein